MTLSGSFFDGSRGDAEAEHNITFHRWTAGRNSARTGDGFRISTDRDRLGRKMPERGFGPSPSLHGGRAPCIRSSITTAAPVIGEERGLPKSISSIHRNACCRLIVAPPASETHAPAQSQSIQEADQVVFQELRFVQRACLESAGAIQSPLVVCAHVGFPPATAIIAAETQRAARNRGVRMLDPNQA